MKWYLKKFEDLNVQEIYEILKLRNEVFVVEQQSIYQDCDGKDKNAYHLYLEDEGEIVANVRILGRGVSYDEVSIGRIIVKKNHRGTGIAQELVSKAIKFVEEDFKETEIRISAQSYLLNFYRSFGFKETSEEYLEDGLPHVEMFYKK